MTAPPLQSPFPYFGGKSRIADEVWRRLGDVPNFVDPFFGSGSLLLGRPPFTGNRTETVNDLDCLLANLWRAVQAEPEAVARWADWPVSEVDLAARHLWLVNRKPAIADRMLADPDWYDAKAAGWWLWGICCWIGSGWCSGTGPWQINEHSTGLAHRDLGNAGQGVNRQRPHLGDAGQGVNRRLPHLGDAGQGVNRQLPDLGNAGRGVNRQLPDGVEADSLAAITGYMRRLQARLRRVRVCCGDWTRVLGESVTTKHGLTGVVLDPPYSHDLRDPGLYAEESGTVSADVRAWALEHGDDPNFRIALFGYDELGEDMPSNWERVAWKAAGGYGSQGNGRARTNASRERVWFSPHCLKVDLFSWFADQQPHEL